MNVFFFGCRGSTPVSGAEYQRYGTATSCIGVGTGAAASYADAAARRAAPRLVLDAGTGFINLERVLGGEPFRGSVCITHLHWDHTHGLPFLREACLPGHRVDVYVPGQGAGDAEAVMNRAFAPPHFPVPIGTLGDSWSVTGIEPGTMELEGMSVLAEEIPHKGSRTFGYRVSDGTSSLAYLPDHKPLALGPGPEGLGEYHPAAMALAAGVDLLVHDSQHTAAELPALAFLGHSAAEYAVGLGVAAGAKAVALFHHDPHRTDAQIDGIVAHLQRPGVRVFAAHEGMVLSLPLAGEGADGTCGTGGTDVSPASA
jgi:phosphoribosyl 1,2-cyclic phosphodiesterase